MKTLKVGVALCAALALGVPVGAYAVPRDSNGAPYVAPSYGSEKNVNPSTGYPGYPLPSGGYPAYPSPSPAASEQTGDSVYVLAVPQEKFVSPDGVLRAGVTPNGDVALTVAAYSTELDGVCEQVGAASDGGSDKRVAVALDQAVSDVEALATPTDLGEFQAELVDLAERQAVLLRTLPQASNAAALGAELEQIEVEIEDLFAQQGGFEVCGQEA